MVTTGRRSVVVSPAEGLSSSQAAARLAADANVLPARHRVGLWRRVLLQLQDPLVPVLLAAAVLTVATGDWPDAAIIAVVVVANTTVGVAQEVCAAATAGYAAIRLDRVVHPTNRPTIRTATPTGGSS